MSDTESFFLVLILLHVVEGILWVRAGAVVFRRDLLGRWSSSRGGFARNREGALVFVNPLPPFGAATFAHPWPVAVSAEGISARRFPHLALELAPSPPSRFHAWDEIESVHAQGEEIRVDGRLLCRAGSSDRAAAVAAFLQRVGSSPAERRDDLIRDELARAADPAAVSARFERLRSGERIGRVLGNLLFLALFVALPVSVSVQGALRSWPVAAFAVLPLWIAALVRFHVRHARLHPSQRGARWSQTAVHVLLAPAVVRAEEHLVRGLATAHDPLAVALALCPEADVRDLGRRALLDLSHPASLEISSDPTERRTEDSFRRALRAAYAGSLRRAGHDPDALLAAPEPLDEECRSWCPRCRFQYVQAAGDCPDCGLRLEPFRTA